MFSCGVVMYGAADMGSQINGGRVFWHASPREVNGFAVIRRFAAAVGNAADERQVFGAVWLPCRSAVGN
eukprot:11207076-Lingulodinium_polyedra.AAC.1